MKLWWLKLKISYLAIFRIFKQPRYVALSLMIFTLILGFMIWLFNLNLFYFIVFKSPLDAGAKFMFVLNSFGAVFTNFDSVGAVVLLTFSVLLTINLTALWYVVKQAGSLATKEGGKSGLSLAAAVIGTGCAACGTGLLGPLLAVVGASSSVGLAEAVGFGAYIFGIGMVFFSLYGLGKQAANLQARARFQKPLSLKGHSTTI